MLEAWWEEVDRDPIFYIKQNILTGVKETDKNTQKKLVKSLELTDGRVETKLKLKYDMRNSMKSWVLS